MSHVHAPTPLRGSQPGSDWNNKVPHCASADEARHACSGHPAITTYTCWDDLRAVLLSVPDERPQARVYIPTPFPAAFHDTLQERCAQMRCQARTNADLMVACKWLYRHHRSAVIVCIRGDRLWFLPYANPAYVNTWQHARVDSAVVQHCHRHRPADAGQWNPDVRRWWSNGQMLCTGVPTGNPQVSDRGLTATIDLLRAAMRTSGNIDVSFVLNRRDCQMLPRGWRNGRPADNPFGDALPVSPAPACALPVFSSYVRPGAADDIGFVEPSQWSAVNKAFFPQLHGQPPPAPHERCAVPVRQRAQSAVFRGSITSAERFDLVQQAHNAPRIDVAATGLNNHRLKVALDDVRILGPTSGLPRSAVGSRHFIPLEAQFPRHAVQIVADGHAAADRLFHVLRCSGGAVVHLTQRVPAAGGPHCMWFSELMAGEGNCPVVFCHNVKTLVATVQAMFDPDPRLATGFANAASAFADRYLTRDALVAYTATVLAEVAPA